MTAPINSDSEQQLAERISSCRSKLSRQPGDRALRLKLADLLARAGQFDEAIEAYRKILARKPGNDRAKSGLRKIARMLGDAARQHRREGRLDEAVSISRQSLDLDPGNADAWLVLGVALYQLKQHDEACRHWQKAAELDPQLADAHQNIAVHLLKCGKKDEAVSAFRRALEAKPTHDASCASLVKLLTDLGRYDEAGAAGARLLGIRPDAPETIAAMATLLERRGSIDEAFEFLLPHMQGEVQSSSLVNAFGKVCHRKKPVSDQAIPYLLALLEKRALRRPERIKTLTTLAQLCDATDRYADALRYLKAARELDTIDMRVVRQRINFADSARIHYTRARLDQLPHAKNHSPIPLFVVGMPRSGTTLTEQILTAHPQAHGAGELTHVGKTVVSGFGTNKPLPDYFDLIDQQTIDRVSRTLLSTLLELAPNTRRVVDKMPLNFLHLGAIELLMPGARVIHCTRHPLDTCISIFFNDFAEALPYTRKFSTLAQYYRSYVALMRHWKETVRIPIFDLNYETLVAEPEATIRDLLAFCDLDWNDNCLRFSEQRRHVDTPSYHQVRQPLYNRSVGRYKHYQEGLSELIEALGDVLDDWPN